MVQVLEVSDGGADEVDQEEIEERESHKVPVLNVLIGRVDIRRESYIRSLQRIITPIPMNHISPKGNTKLLLKEFIILRMNMEQDTKFRMAIVEIILNTLHIHFSSIQVKDEILILNMDMDMMLRYTILTLRVGTGSRVDIMAPDKRKIILSISLSTNPHQDIIMGSILRTEGININ
jgi:hypothetical protein